MTPTDVDPNTVVETPESYEQFEARMETEEAASAATTAEDIEDAEIAEEPETPGSAPGTSEEQPPSAEPAKEPEPAPASEPVKPIQEQTAQEEESKGGIPQSRIDEVTRFRRLAEEARDTEKARADQLARELAELKAKPSQPEKTEAVKVEIDEAALAAKVEAEVPQVPEIPIEPDPSKYEAGEYDRQYIKDLASWMFKVDKHADQVEARKQEVARRIETGKSEARKQAENDAQSKSVEEAEKTQATERFNGSLAVAKGKHADFDAVVNAQQFRGHVFPGALIFGVQMSDDPGELIYHLCSNPDTLERLEKVAALPDKPTFRQRQQIQRAVDIEISKIEAKLSQATEPAPSPAPAKPKAPENLKPSVTRAPPPPDNVRPSAGAHAPSVPSNFNEWDSDQERREQSRRRR